MWVLGNSGRISIKGKGLVFLLFWEVREKREECNVIVVFLCFGN